jgi:autotransporter adhesin
MPTFVFLTQNHWEDGHLFGAVTSYVDSEAATHEFGIQGVTDIIKPLDEKYLPDFVRNFAGQHAWRATYEVDGETYIAQHGAEIFNDYAENIAVGEYSHAEGEHSIALGSDSHAEGCYTKAKGYSSHAEGSHTEASGEDSHAEGHDTTASGYYSHAEGRYTSASGRSSHAEGEHTKASGEY